jgi:Spy/CpxP family protein refolding chaperone
MVRRHPFLLIGTLVLALLGVGSWLYAQAPGPGGGPGGRARAAGRLGGPGFGGPGPGFGFGGRGAGLRLGALDLTEAQRDQVRQLTQQFREQMRPSAERMRQSMEARRAAAQATPPDESGIRAAMQEMAQIQSDMAVQAAQLRSQILALLTPEQRQKADEVAAQREARVKQRQARIRERRQQAPAQ